MADTRALMTRREQEQMAGKHGDDRKYQATTRLRKRVNERLTEDIAVLAEHHPEMLEEVREVVCGELPDEYPNL